MPVSAYANRTAVPEPLRGTSGAAHVRSLGDLPYGIIVGEKQNQLDSPVLNRTNVMVIGDGASYLAIEYMNLGAASGKLLYVVFEAPSDADANAMLATPGQRYVIPIGGWREWAFEVPLQRIDFCSDAASEGSSLVTWEYGLL